MRRSQSIVLLCLAVTLPCLGSCTRWFFSGESWPDHSRPVALIETTGGVELGATTEYGILTLGRTATEGACRVHYFLGPTPMVDDGVLDTTTSVFTRADIDLKTQAVRMFDRSVNQTDELLVMWTADGTSVRSVEVKLARTDGIEGSVLLYPGVELPVGATVLRRDRYGLTFVGLIAGKATVDNDEGSRNYFVYAGVDRVRKMLAIPEKYPVDYAPRYRTDGITVLKPIK